VTDATTAQTDYMSVAQVAHELNLSRMTVYRMCESGQLACIRTGFKGKTIRIPRIAFEQHTEPKQPAPAVIPGQIEIAE
jgi:excisionase family DNA binding protein